MNSCPGNQTDDTYNPLCDTIQHTLASFDCTHDIEMGDQLSTDECTICFSDIPSDGRSYGCGNPKCNGKFCDECVAELSYRHVHAPRCCNCTEPCGAEYTSRLNSIQAVLFVYSGDHYMIVSSVEAGTPHTSHETSRKDVKLIKTPVISSDLSSLRTAYKRATDIPEDRSIIQRANFERTARYIQWLHDVDNVRWGKLTHTIQRYITVNYHMIYLLNGIVSSLMCGIMLLFGKEMFSSPRSVYTVDVMCMFTNIVVTIASYWLFMLQILYNDVGVFSKNEIRWRLLVFGTSNTTIMVNNVLMLERILGDGKDAHVAMYMINFILHGGVALWTRRLSKF